MVKKRPFRSPLSANKADDDDDFDQTMRRSLVKEPYRSPPKPHFSVPSDSDDDDEVSNRNNSGRGKARIIVESNQNGDMGAVGGRRFPKRTGHWSDF